MDLFVELCKEELGIEIEKEYRVCKERRWRFDYAYPKCMIALEVEGGVFIRGRHTRPKGFLADMEKYNYATLMGWRVFRTTPDKLCSEEVIDWFKKMIANE